MGPLGGKLGPMFASLPMYDLPELREQTDLLWAEVAKRLRARGTAAPGRLARPADLPGDWLRPDLLLSQACGLPFVRRLRGRVALVGAADHGLPDCDPGCYRSRVVVRREDTVEGWSGLEGRIVAVNSEDSQSGAGALRREMARHGTGGSSRPFFDRVLLTGAHLVSIRAVAEGRADLAAIDAVTWELALRHLAEARALRVLLSTPETPGLPFVTRREGPADTLRAALGEAVEAVGPELRGALMLHGIVRRVEADFDGIARADAECPPLAPG